jgi:hypothetical protein
MRRGGLPRPLSGPSAARGNAPSLPAALDGRAAELKRGDNQHAEISATSQAERSCAVRGVMCWLGRDGMTGM